MRSSIIEKYKIIFSMNIKGKLSSTKQEINAENQMQDEKKVYLKRKPASQDHEINR